MKKCMAPWLLLFGCLALCPLVLGQQKAESKNAAKQQAASPEATTEQKNVKEYIELLRSNVRQQKAQIMGAVMQLDVDQSAKFWPIYSEYDAELTQLNNFRVSNIQEYARSYDQMTDAKADELIQNAFKYRKERSELLTKYYRRVKDALGGVQAARFLQVEDQLLLIIDLQIAASLPVVEQGS